MSTLLAVLALALVFYFIHRMPGGPGGCGAGHTGGEGGHAHGQTSPRQMPSGPDEGRAPRSAAAVLVVTLILLLPLLLLHALLPAGSPVHPLLFLAFLLLAVVGLPAWWAVAGRRRQLAEARARAAHDAHLDQPLVQAPAAFAEGTAEAPATVGLLENRVAGVMDVQGRRRIGDVVAFEGTLRAEPEQAWRELSREFAELGRSPRLLEGEDGTAVVVALPAGAEEAPPQPPRLTVPLLLFVATLVTTTFAGALHQGVNLWREPARFAVGLPYSLALMGILVFHEMGHYLLGRLRRIHVTPPYFIPIPMGLGTFGAFIQIRGEIPDRRKLFDVAVAGPLAGLMIAVPALYLGLKQSVPAPPGMGIDLSSSVLLAWLYGLANGGAAPADHTLRFTALGFAGWLGLVVTALNLIPVGQLDGGHIAYALFGRRRAEMVARTALVLLLILGVFYWSGWLTWAILIFFLGGVRHAPAPNELTGLGGGRRAIGALAFVLLFLIMAPVPHRFMMALGIACPYVGGP